MRSFLASAAPLAPASMALAPLILAFAVLPAPAQAQTAETPPRAASPAAAQAAPSSSDRTRDLNSGPPIPAQYLSPPAAAPGRTVTAPTASRPSATPVGAPTPTPAAAPTTAAPAATAAPRPATAAPTPARPSSASSSVSPVARPAASPPPAAAPAGPPPPAPNVPAVTVLNPAARAALPFTIDLPAGFELVTGRPGPDFKIYTVRRGQTSFAMIYAGPSSQFPLYTGETVQAAGRTSIIVTEDGRRRAMEHLFERPDAPAGSPREIHVWTMSLEGQDRALAERIAQSVDIR